MPFPTPGQWAEQIDGTLPTLQITQNDQWMTIRLHVAECSRDFHCLRLCCVVAQLRNYATCSCTKT